MRHRPIGIGVQGLADMFILMRYPFDSPEAKQLNRDVFERIYYAAVKESVALAKLFGAYDSYEGSPVSRGVLQFDMWPGTATRLPWDEVRREIALYGMRNSLLVAPMPTASTSQILGNNECIEPYTSNVYTRRVLSGEFQVVNYHLMNDLAKLGTQSALWMHLFGLLHVLRTLLFVGLWNEEMKLQLIAHNGSVQRIPLVPDDLKALYKYCTTVFYEF